MKIRHKLMILAAIPNLGLAFLGWQAFSERTHGVAEMHTLESLALLARDISSIIHEVQTERGFSAAYLGSDGDRFGPELTEQHRATDQRARTLRETLGTINTDRLPPTFSTTLTSATNRLLKLDHLRRSVLDKDIRSARAVSEYTEIINDLMGVIALFSTRGSDARLSAQLHAYDLFMRGKDHAGVERAILADAFARDSFDDGEYRWFVAMVAEQTAHFEGFLALADPELASAFLSISETDAAAKIDQYRQIAHEHAATGGFSASAADWFRAASKRIQSLRELDIAILQNITSATHAAHSKAEASRTSLGVVVAVLIIGSVAITLTIGRFIARPIGVLVQRIQEIAEGDLTKRVEVTGADELGELGRCFNAFVDRFHRIMSDVSGATREVASAATQIAASSEQMAAGLADQQEQRVQISAAVEQMFATVTDVAGRSADAASAAEASGREATEGGRVVAQTVEEMNGIAAQVSQASLAVVELGRKGEQIGEIIGVINDIADQANLLALNAAIEAARAGEHGRGFAVVADEVRKLAERTTTATEQVAQSIRQIRTETGTAIEQIEAGTSRVSRGVELAHGAGEALARIVQASRSVQSMVQSIAAASEEQSTSTQQIARSMEQIDVVTRESTEGARQASGAAAQMSLLADSLRTLIGRFTI